jgi:regulator of protease activity HflC (stomatin/prohibitin superfamily)
MGIIAFVFVAVLGAQYDAESHRLQARGAAAADVRAPSAAIARVKAERQARERAEKKLAAALKELGHKSADILKNAQIADEQFGSDGSVELTLELDTTGLKLHQP